MAATHEDHSTCVKYGTQELGGQLSTRAENYNPRVAQKSRERNELLAPCWNLQNVSKLIGLQCQCNTTTTTTTNNNNNKDF